MSKLTRVNNLKEAISALRAVADYLEQVQVSATEPRPHIGEARSKTAEARNEKIPDINQLAKEVSALDRPRLIERLPQLTTSQLRSLCVAMSMRGMSKRSKDDLIREIVRHRFDFSKELEVIRTYSQRQAETNH